MPVSTTQLITEGSAANSTTYTTSSFTVQPNTLVLASVGGDGTIGTTSLSGLGMTWTQIATKQDSVPARRITMFRGVPTGTNTGAVTITWSAAATNGCNWSFTQCSNVDLTGSNGVNAIVQNATNTAAATGSLTVTLGAFSSTNNATYASIFINANFSITKGSGYTELGQNNTLRTIESQWRVDNDTSPSWTWSPNAVSVGIAVELKFAPQATAGFLYNLIT